MSDLSQIPKSYSDTCNGPIFVCGPSRSGTALVRAILNRHPRIFLAGETHYFDDLRQKLGALAGERLQDDRITQCEDYFLSLSHRPYGHSGSPEMSRMARETLTHRASELGGSGDSYFEAYCRLLADGSSADIWGEKTPRHIYCIPELLSTYPQAKVICLIRDVRAVMASYRDWKNQGGFDLQADPGHIEALEREEKRAKRSYHPIMCALLWNGAMKSALNALNRFGASRVRLEKYEDLASNADGAIPSLTEWLGVDFREDMIDVPMHNSSYNQFEKGSGVSQTPIDRWKNKLPASEVAAAETVSGGLMKELGYPLISPNTRTLRSIKHWVTLPYCVGRAVMANRGRMVKFSSYVKRRV